MKRKTLAAALGMACWAMSIAAQATSELEREHGAPRRALAQPLSPAEVDAIQHIGGNVLVAKRGQSESPEVQALVQEFQALAQEMDQAMVRMSAPTATAPPSAGPAQPKTAKVLQVQSTPTYQVVMGEGKFVRQEAVTPVAQPSPQSFVPRAAIAPQLANDDARFNPMRQHLAKLDELMQKYDTAAQTRGDADLIRAHAIGAKVAQLRDALHAFMDNPSATPDSGEQLRALQKRLHFESRDDLARDDLEKRANRERRSGRDDHEHAEQPTPTLTGFTGHR